MRTVFVLFVLLIPNLVNAHGGGLDQCGGHYNRKTGQYHIHRYYDDVKCQAHYRQKLSQPYQKGKQK